MLFEQFPKLIRMNSSTCISASVMTGLSLVGIMVCAYTGYAQPAIANIYADGTNMLQPSSTLIFIAGSPAEGANAIVVLTVTNLYTGQCFLKNLTAASGLTITRSNTGLSVSAASSGNMVYAAVISVGDANGSVA